MPALISVVVPVYNEQDALPAFLAMASRWTGAPYELVFSDGGSTDRTCAVLRAAGMRVVEGPKGRGGQCDRGVQASRGDAVLFLHADESCGPDTLAQVAAALDAGVPWGCLTLRWTRRGPVYRFGELMSNLRARLGGVPFGDQGPFLTRDLLDRAGGVPAIPIMEDYELALRLRALGLRPRQLPCEVWASPRRFEEGGALRTSLQMFRLRRLYRAGADPAELAALYRDVRAPAKAPAHPDPDARGAADGRTAAILFTRVPVPGRVKTRLLPALSPQGCAELQRALALDAAARLAACPAVTPVVYLSDEDLPAGSGGPARTGAPGPAPSAFAADLAQAAGPVRVERQTGAGLGARMAGALEAELARGAQACLLMGSDLPLADETVVARATALLREPAVDVVLGPTADGGYWLVGLRRPFPQLFAGERYGTAGVLQEALATCRAHGRTVALAPALRDVDTPDDLAWLAGLAAAGDPCVGPRTRAAVARLAPGGPAAAGSSPAPR